MAGNDELELESWLMSVKIGLVKSNFLRFLGLEFIARHVSKISKGMKRPKTRGKRLKLREKPRKFSDWILAREFGAKNSELSLGYLK